MRKFLIALAVGGAVAVVAAPALAQAIDTVQREDDVRARIDDGVRDGDLTYSQAARLRTELRQIVRLDSRYRYEGMAGWQARDLDSRLDLLDSRVSYEVSATRDDREYGSGYYR